MITRSQKKSSTESFRAMVATLEGLTFATDASSMEFDYLVTDLGTLGGSWSYAVSINGAEEIIGYSSTKFRAEHAFKWNKGTLTDLGTSTAPKNGLMIDLSTLGGENSIANGINKVGQVVGYSFTSNSGSGAYHAFLWDNGSARDLGTLGGSYSKAYGINDAGMIVGESLTRKGACHAFLWNNGTMIDLNELLSPNSDWILHRALGINNKGQIVGGGTLNGQLRAFFLTPVKYLL